VSEPKPEQTPAGPGSVGAGSIVPTSSLSQGAVPVAASGAGPVDAPTIAPDHETLPKEEPRIGTPKLETSKIEASKIEASKIEASKIEASKIEAPKPEAMKIDKVEAPRLDPIKAGAANADSLKAESFTPNASGTIGRLLIMSPGDRARHGAGASSRPASDHGSDAPGKRRFAGMAAVVALATLAGAFGGALATTALIQFAGGDAATGQTANQALEASVARIDADVLALKAGLDHTAKLGMSQFNKTSDRLDKIEKAQAEPAAKLAKLSEALDKFGAAPAAATPVAAKEVTGSVTRPAGAAAQPATAVANAAPAAAPPKTEVARLPTVDSWILREVAHGGALIEGRQGLYEVYAGDPVPGLGRVDAIRKQDGRWVVVTSRGLIVAR
jgi:hypothetical protein